MRAAGRRSFTRLSHDRPPGGHLPPCPLSLVANGRAQPKDRGGIRETQERRSSHGRHKVTTSWRRAPSGSGGGGTKNKKQKNTHTFPRFRQPACCVTDDREGSIELGLDRPANSPLLPTPPPPPGQKQYCSPASPSRREAPACGSGGAR